MTSSVIDKKLEINEKPEINSKFTKNLEIKLEIYKNLEIKLEIYSYFKLENKLEMFEFFVNGRWTQYKDKFMRPNSIQQQICHFSRVWGGELWTRTRGN